MDGVASMHGRPVGAAAELVRVAMRKRNDIARREAHRFAARQAEPALTCGNQVADRHPLAGRAVRARERGALRRRHAPRLAELRVQEERALQSNDAQRVGEDIHRGLRRFGQ